MNNKFEIGKEAAIKYIMFKKRTANEVAEKLKSLNYNEGTIDRIIEYLREANYINDEVYARKYLDELQHLKNWSAMQVKEDLYRRGISDALDSETLNEYEKSSIKHLIEKFTAKYPNYTDDDKKHFVNLLMRKGFKYDNIKSVMTEE